MAPFSMNIGGLKAHYECTPSYVTSKKERERKKGKLYR